MKKDSVRGIDSFTFEGYTVGEVISILKTFPKDYQFLMSGKSGYAIWVDHTSGIVSIDDEAWINNQMNELKKL